MRGFFDHNVITIFGKDIPFLSVFIFFMVLLFICFIIFTLTFIFGKKKYIEKQTSSQMEITKIDEEINSIVKKYKTKDSVKEEKLNE